MFENYNYNSTMLNKRLLLSFIIIIISFVNIKAQSNQTDSLFQLLKKANNDTTKCNIYLELGLEIFWDNPDSAFACFNRGLILSLTSNSKKHQALANFYIGRYYYFKDSYEKAIEYYSTALNIFETNYDKKGTYKCYNNIGLAYLYQGMYDLALNYFLKALKIAEEIGDKRSMSMTNSNIGLVHDDQKNYQKALEYFNYSLKIDEAIDDKDGMSYSYINIGNIYAKQESFDLALNYFTKALKIKEELDDKSGMSTCYTNIGFIYNKKGNYSLALQYFLKSVKMDENLQDKKGLATNYNEISILYYTMSKVPNLNETQINNYCNQSISYALKAINLSKEINAVFLQNEAAKSLMEAYLKLGNYKKYAEYSKIFIDTKDSLFNTEKTQAITDAEAKFKNEKKQIEIEKLNNEKEFQKIEILRQQQLGKTKNIIIIFIIIGLILIAIFAVFIVHRLRITNRQKHTIEEQMVLLNQQNEEIRAQRDLVIQQRDCIDEQKQSITNSINYAKRIQKALFPKSEFIDTIIKEYFIFFKPKDIVSGDFYWVSKSNEFIIIAVADCTGHGVPGAFMSMLGITSLREIVRHSEELKASNILNDLRESIIRALQQKGDFKEQKDGMDISLCILNTTNNLLQYAGAYNPLYIVHKNKELTIIDADKQPISISINPIPFNNKEIQLSNGDCIYLATDGYKDQFGGEKEEKFKSKNFKNLLINISDKTIIEQSTIVSKTFEDWKGKINQIDDVTVFGMRI